MKYDFIAKWANEFPIRLMCRTLHVNKSAYYVWKANGAKTISAQDLRLRQRMRALFDRSRRSLGSRTLTQGLRGEGFRIGRYRVRQLMKRLGLVVKAKRRFRVTTDSRHGLPVAANVLARQFNPTGVNQVWASDITFIWTQEGWLYLAVVIDLHSRRVVGWCIDRRMTQALVIRALRMAIAQRKPPAGMIHHSDRGSQYASDDYQALLKQHGITVSMSRKGNCWDNGVPRRHAGGTIPSCSYAA